MASKNLKRADWLVLLYVVADDVELGEEGGTLEDECNRMMKYLTGATIDPKVAIVALTDDNLLPDMYKSPDYMRPAIRVLERNEWIDQEQALDEETLLLFDRVNGKPELDTGSPRTLAYFIRWALREYQAKNIMLSIIGHGGGWSDLHPSERKSTQSNKNVSGSTSGSGSFQPVKAGGGHSPSLNGLCPDSTSQTALSTPDLRRALGFGLDGRKLDVLFLDSCLMGMIEVAYELRDHAQYLIAGESLLWAQLPYEVYLGNSNLKSDTKPEDLARSIVKKYNSRSSKEQKSWALAAINLANIDLLQKQVEQLASKLLALIDEKQEKAIQSIALAYSYSQQFDDNADFKVNRKESYVDIRDFVLNLAEGMNDYTLSPMLSESREVVAADSSIEKLIDLNNIVRRKAKNNKIVPQPGVANIDAGFDPSKVIFSALAQTDEEVDLDNSYGLSIYFPLGDIVDAAEKLPANKMAPKDERRTAIQTLNLHLARYKSQLRFTQDTPSWVELLDKLRKVLKNNTADLYREEEEPIPAERMALRGKIVSRSFEPPSTSVRIFRRPRQRG